MVPKLDKAKTMQQVTIELKTKKTKNNLLALLPQNCFVI